MASVTSRNTCQLCGSARDGRTRSTPCVVCHHTHADAADACMATLCRVLPGDRYAVTVAIADIIRTTGYRFDSSWRHADDGPKAAAYARCCTVTANDLADDPRMVAFWQSYLSQRKAG